MSRFTTSRITRKANQSWRKNIGTGATIAKSRSTVSLLGLNGALRSARSSASNYGKTAKSKSVGQHWRNKPDVIVYRDGRERCNPGTPGGRREYLRRKQELFDRQQGLCCICLLPLGNDCTFDHELGRTSGKIDERLFVNGKPRNGVSHLACNSRRGSQKTKIYHYPQLERRRA